MREGAPSTEHRSRAICDLQSVMRGEQRLRGASKPVTKTTRGELRRRWTSIGVFLVWFWFALYCFFLFLINTFCIGVCFAFSLYRLYWGLVFSAFSANDVIVDLIFDSLCFFFLRICGWVCYLCNLLGLSWVWLCYNFFFFFRFYFNFFFDIFFLLESWTDIYLYIYIYIKFEGVPNTD